MYFMSTACCLQTVKCRATTDHNNHVTAALYPHRDDAFCLWNVCCNTLQTVGTGGFKALSIISETGFTSGDNGEQTGKNISCLFSWFHTL